MVVFNVHLMSVLTLSLEASSLARPPDFSSVSMRLALSSDMMGCMLRQCTRVSYLLRLGISQLQMRSFK